MSYMYPMNMTEQELRLRIMGLERRQEAEGLNYAQAMLLRDLYHYLAMIEWARRASR